MTGVDIESTKFYPILKKLAQYDLVEEEGNIIRLTSKGAFFADEVVECFYDTPFIPFERKFYNDGPLSPYVINEEIR